MPFFGGRNINDVIYKLRVAKEPVDQLHKRNQEIIDEEIRCLELFIKKIKPFLTKKIINEQECIEIYRFVDSDKELIGKEVYLAPDFRVVYQVFDEYLYRGYVPHAEVSGGYAYNSLDFFLRNISLEDIINFFLEQPELLTDHKLRLEKENEERAEYLEYFKGIIKSLK